MNGKKAGTGTNERADGNQTTSYSAPKNDLLPNKPWIPEKQRWTNREALEEFQQKRAERVAKKAAGMFETVRVVCCVSYVLCRG
jgi:hypothetical protein